MSELSSSQRRSTLSLPQRDGFPRLRAITDQTDPVRRPKGNNNARGHESVLNAIQKSGRIANVILQSGEERRGPIVGRDPYTITVLYEGTRRLIFKHAIEELWSDEATAEASED